MNYRMICRVLGWILLIYAALMLLPLIPQKQRLLPLQAMLTLLQIPPRVLPTQVSLM